MNYKLIAVLVLMQYTIVSGIVQAGDKFPIADIASKVNPLNLGSKIPNVGLWTGYGDPVHLRKITYKKPSVIYFYQGAWMPICSKQLNELRDIAEKLDAIGFQLIGISPDSPRRLIKTRKKQKLNFMLLSDYHLDAARGFGIAYRLTKKEERLARKKYGADLRYIKGEEGYNLPVPGFFIVDTQGIIHFQYVNPNLKQQMTTDFLLSAAQMVSTSIKTD